MKILSPLYRKGRICFDTAMVRAKTEKEAMF
jgi:hypothetical protein